MEEAIHPLCDFRIMINNKQGSRIVTDLVSSVLIYKRIHKLADLSTNLLNYSQTYLIIYKFSYLFINLTLPFLLPNSFGRGFLGPHLFYILKTEESGKSEKSDEASEPVDLFK